MTVRDWFSPSRWNPRSLAGGVILLLLLAALVAWRAYGNWAILHEDLTVDSVPLAPAGEKIDPNTATWANLSRLPRVGPGLAKAIVAYRMRAEQARPGQVVFLRAQDLQNVSGIGPATVQAIEPFLTFPAAATTPSVE